ncbi:MAG: stage V sporulation protein AD, partial [Clostridia bacterium]|nr:stage V sporulation protein AD [Clostridia bacterium]
MAQRKGKTIFLKSKPRIIANAGVAGKKEGEGPLGCEFDEIFEDTTMGQDCWEKAETELVKSAIETAISKSALQKSEIDAVFAGDLLNQCIGSSFAMREICTPFVGLYGACSTMALSLCMASLALETGGFDNCIAATSSHFCS